MTETEAWAAQLPPHEGSKPTDKIDTSTEAVERLLEDVTPGPWYRDAWDIRSDGPGTGAICEVAKPNGDDDQYWKNGEADANARFIAAARELVPALLKERDEARARVAPSLRITGPNSDGEYWLHIKAGGRSGGVNLGGEHGPICKRLLDAASETGAKE